MPELPEVETTTQGLRKKIVGLTIHDAWTDLSTKDKRKHDTIANEKFFKLFKKEVVGKKIISVERRAKNILINLSNSKTILVHMKMTGHLLYGKYKFGFFKDGPWGNSLKDRPFWIPNEKIDSPLYDPFNRFIHFVFIFSNGKHLAFSDTRKFGKITLLDTEKMHTTKHLENLGPEPLDKSFDLKKLRECLGKKPSAGGRRKIKTVLMDQGVLAGIGNIYSDEILWYASVHPERQIKNLSEKEIKIIFKGIKEILNKGINFGGDSMSDYRNIDGVPGKFQLHHNVYRRKGETCKRKNCSGIIQRKVINGRSAHFCNIHQK